jgi:cytochrome c oxidase cbb3-type subunit III
MRDMSGFWHWFIIIIVIINVAGSLWLMFANAKIPRAELEDGDTTGHTWDGDLAEYNNPLPMWWMGLFVISAIFLVVYLYMYPGLGDAEGSLGWTQESQYAAEVEAAEAQLAETFGRYEGADVLALAADPDALALGRNVFANNCTTCHGSDARGAPGFPDLTDAVWNWGGEPDRVLETILEGRSGMMPANLAMLGDEGVEQLAHYLRQLSGGEFVAAKADLGAQRFAFCAACHGMDGTGNPMLGALDLTDDTWLYGSGFDTIRASIADGRNGVMPPHRDLIGETRARLVAAYVLSLNDR